MILDTNAVSALAVGSEALVTVLGGGGSKPVVDVLAIPVIVLGEFEFGIARSRHRARYRRWLERLVEVANVLDIDQRTAAHYATIREKLRARGRPIPSNDTWIAALALQHDLRIVSRDAHFDEVDDVRRVAW